MHRSPARLALLVPALLAIFVFSTDAAAQTRPGRPFPPGVPEIRLMLQQSEALGLSEEKRKDLEDLIAEVNAEDEKLREQNQEATNELRRLLNEALPSEEAVREVSDRIGDIANRGRDLSLRCSLRARSLLTAEQRREFMEIRRQTRVKRPKGNQNRR